MKRTLSQNNTDYTSKGEKKISYVEYCIGALTLKRPDKKKNEDCIAIEPYGIFQNDLYMEGDVVNQPCKLVVADGVSSSRPYASAASYAAVKSFLEGKSLDQMNKEVMETYGYTTLDAVKLVGNRMKLTHIGDSFVYLVRKGRIIPLTFPHGSAERIYLEQGVKVRGSLLENYLGKKAFQSLDAGVDTIELQDNDTIYLMSDGVEKLFFKWTFRWYMRRKTLMEKVRDKLNLKDDTSLIEVNIHIK